MFCLFAATLSFTPAFRPAFMAVEQSGLPATLGALTGAATAAAMAPYVAGGAGSMQAAVAAETTMQAPQAEIAGSIVFSVALVYVFLHYNKKYAGVDLLEEWPEACLIEGGGAALRQPLVRLDGRLCVHRDVGERQAALGVLVREEPGSR